MNEAYWFPIELIAIQLAVIGTLELIWRFACWKANRNERLQG